MNLVVGIVLGLILGAIVYSVAALFLPYVAAIALGVLVFLLCVFGGPHYYGRRGL